MQLQNRTALHIAVTHGHLQFVTELVLSDADLELSDNHVSADLPLPPVKTQCLLLPVLVWLGML